MPIYNLHPSPGVAAKIGFWVSQVPTTLDINVSPTPPYNVIASLRNTPQIVEVLSAVTTLWGTPPTRPTTPTAGAVPS